VQISRIFRPRSTETVDLEWFADNTPYVLNYWEAAVI